MTFACQLLWLLASLPGWLRFQWALRHPRRAQEQVLRRLIKANRGTAFGQAHDFAAIRTQEEFSSRVPFAEYEAFADSIRLAREGHAFPLAAERPELLEPTSGSSGAPKLIPVTPQLRREFAAAVQPWIAWLLLAHPRLLLGRHYWAVSPNTRPLAGTSQTTDRVPIGFSDDADYLGVFGRFVARGILANPADLRNVTDPESFTKLTLLFLLAERNLRLVSVWHPSFLTVLLAALPRHLPEVLAALRCGELPGGAAADATAREAIGQRFRGDRRRADELEALDLARNPERLAQVWPKLEIISCWAGPRSEPWLGELRRLFPRAAIQPKGLLATEGCVSIPTGCGRKRPCAVTSHYFEFVRFEDGVAVPVWKLVLGQEYSVVLTTGGGLWRYRLHDRVKVVDFCHATPCLEFLGKDNAVSDMVGEKLDERHVAEAFAEVLAGGDNTPIFAMLVPDPGWAGRSAAGYLLLFEAGQVAVAQEALPRWCERVERCLRRNYHYDHACNRGQLAPLRGVLVREGARSYREAAVRRGARIGTIKIPALDWRSVDSGTVWWQTVSDGE
ncbi:MAG TPA: GH3 auxin-responsive promoter family protein [Opitutaceae bacterium]|nr:GH3 auxin-responsive promoter family protein [Opitutaceae bacterium]